MCVFFDIFRNLKAVFVQLDLVETMHFLQAKHFMKIQNFQLEKLLKRL